MYVVVASLNWNRHSCKNWRKPQEKFPFLFQCFFCVCKFPQNYRFSSTKHIWERMKKKNQKSCFLCKPQLHSWVGFIESNKMCFRSRERCVAKYKYTTQNDAKYIHTQAMVILETIVNEKFVKFCCRNFTNSYSLHLKWIVSETDVESKQKKTFIRNRR